MRHDWTLRRQTRASVARAEAVDDCGGSILYLDEQALTRDCIGRELARRLPEFKIAERATARDLNAGDNATKFALAILYVHADRVAFRATDGSPDHDGIAAQLALLEEVAPNTPRVLMSELEVPEDILEAFRRRIRGYVPTTLPMKQVAEAIRFVAAGGTFVPPSLLLTLHGQPATHQEAAQTPSVAAQLLDFSPRQNEVLQMLWNGCSNKLIAYELGMSESTVKVHIRHIMKKLHVSNRTQVVLRTRPDGHVDLHPKSPSLPLPCQSVTPAPIPEIRAILDQTNGRSHEHVKDGSLRGNPHRT